MGRVVEVAHYGDEAPVRLLKVQALNDIFVDGVLYKYQVLNG